MGGGYLQLGYVLCCRFTPDGRCSDHMSSTSFLCLHTGTPVRYQQLLWSKITTCYECCSVRITIGPLGGPIACCSMGPVACRL